MEIDTYSVISAVHLVDGLPLRSAWDKGVRLYTHELAGNLFYWTSQGKYLHGMEEAKEKAMQEEASWREYSKKGLSLESGEEIAERLCTASELKRCKGGLKAPNKNEGWDDVQARALAQAWEMLEDALWKTARQEV